MNHDLPLTKFFQPRLYSSHRDNEIVVGVDYNQVRYPINRSNGNYRISNILRKRKDSVIIRSCTNNLNVNKTEIYHKTPNNGKNTCCNARIITDGICFHSSSNSTHSHSTSNSKKTLKTYTPIIIALSDIKIDDKLCSDSTSDHVSEELKLSSSGILNHMNHNQGWYWVNSNGETLGPVSLRKLKLLYVEHQLTKHNYLWNGTTINDWTPLQNISHIYNGFLACEQMQNRIQVEMELKVTIVHANDENQLFKCKGYPMEMFSDFDGQSVNILQQFVCEICHNICRDCVEVDCKPGHLFCEYCIVQHFNITDDEITNESFNYCPECDQKNVQYHISQYLRRKIDALSCKCLHFQLGCKQNNVILCQLKSHLIKECVYSEIVCNGCQSVFKRKYYSEHIKICDEYQIECDQCHQNIQRKKVKDHVSVQCEYQTIRCPNYPLCNERYLRRDIAKHLKSECFQRIVKCPYFRLGCNKRMKAKDLMSHLNEYIVKHNQLQFMNIDIICNSHKYIYVQCHQCSHSHISSSVNGLYQRLSIVDIQSINDDLSMSVECSMQPIFRKRCNGEIYLRYNFHFKKWCFMNKQKKILFIQGNKSNCNNPCNIYYWHIYENYNSKIEQKIKITLDGFTDLFLWRKLNYLEACAAIQVYGRQNNINEDMNGIYEKQSHLHCGRSWYLKVNDKHRNKNQWVLRYLPSSEIWLFDKRGLKNDDIANAIGKGDVISPLLIKKWQIHDGNSFILDSSVELREYIHHT